MTDRFKFRVWDNLDEKYYEDDCFQINIGSNGDLFIIGPGNDGEDCFWETNNTVVEQCTGLKDKNGKLIYEGDIVEVGGRYAKGNYKIIFDECDCEYDLKSGNCWFVYQLDSEIADNSEVIGNIHENADLLGEDK